MVYDEAKWAELWDDHDMPIDVSLAMLDRCTCAGSPCFAGMKPEAFASGYMHPEYKRRFTLDQALALYGMAQPPPCRAHHRVAIA